MGRYVTGPLVGWHWRPDLAAGFGSASRSVISSDLFGIRKGPRERETVAADGRVRARVMVSLRPYQFRPPR